MYDILDRQSICNHRINEHQVDSIRIQCSMIYILLVTTVTIFNLMCVDYLPQLLLPPVHTFWEGT